MSKSRCGPAPRIALLKRGATASEQELLLAESLAIPLLEAAVPSSLDLDYYLRLDPAGLGLFSTASDAPGAVRVDFSNQSLNYRVLNKPKHQNLVKAVGLNRVAAHSAPRLRILDATAGLGKDAFLLASLDCCVTMLERSSIVHAMLADGLERALQADNPQAKTAVAATASRLSLRRGDFLDLADALEPVDVVYLDPMFPPRSKSARVKKDMFLLQGLLGHAESQLELLDAALNLAISRVVVKRGKLSPALDQRAPDISYKGRSSRYDVYLTRNS
ncbi:MAG: class I SAM-dependent methyltransferase [Proteobacteria bacterium]|nr:class I SAM-dependent methyltransferase [Pseudomonadota bacterium]